MALHVSALAVGARAAPPRAQLRRPDRRAGTGRVLAVQFEPPYWGALRFELRADGDGTGLRVTQRGFEGNEEWLADFRGGGARSTTASRSVRDRRGRNRSPAGGDASCGAPMEPGELAGALAQLAPRQLAVRPYWYADAGGSRSCFRAWPPPVASKRATSSRATRSASRFRPAPISVRAREPRALAAPARLDSGWPAPRGGGSRSPRGRVRARPPLPTRCRPRGPRAVRAGVRARLLCAGRAAAAAYFAPRGALALAAGHTRGRSTRRSLASHRGRSCASGDCASGATARSRPTGRAAAGRPGATAERAPGRSPRRPHRPARAALRSRRPPHGGRMMAGWRLSSRPSASACTPSPPNSPPLPRPSQS